MDFVYVPVQTRGKSSRRDRASSRYSLLSANEVNFPIKGAKNGILTCSETLVSCCAVEFARRLC